MGLIFKLLAIIGALSMLYFGSPEAASSFTAAYIIMAHSDYK